MSQYRSRDGFANSWHLAHLGRFAIGGAALVFCEATAIQQNARRTHGDLGLWNDTQIDALRPITDFIHNEKSIAGIQLAHAGRKASERRPWHGETPVDKEDIELRNEHPWPASAPCSLPYADGWPEPIAMSEDDIAETIAAFADAARRSVDAGFKLIEVYAAHGFLIHQFLSPIANCRTDQWGGSAENRSRLAVRVARAIRSSIPDSMPLFFRISATDWIDGGLEIEDSIELSRRLVDEGVDLIDCSTGGIGGRERPRRMQIEQGFQAPFAEQIRAQAKIMTMAVGFLWNADFCNNLIKAGSADLVALGRELLDDPNWPLHAADYFNPDHSRSNWPDESGWWLNKRDRLLNKLGIR